MRQFRNKLGVGVGLMGVLIIRSNEAERAAGEISVIWPGIMAGPPVFQKFVSKPSWKFS